MLEIPNGSTSQPDRGGTGIRTIITDLKNKTRPIADWAGRSIKEGLATNDHVIADIERRLSQPHEPGLYRTPAGSYLGYLFDGATVITRRTLAAPFKLAEAYLAPFAKPKEPTEVYKATTTPANPPSNPA